MFIAHLDSFRFDFLVVVFFCAALFWPSNLKEAGSRAVRQAIEDAGTC